MYLASLYKPNTGNKMNGLYKWCVSCILCPCPPMAGIGVHGNLWEFWGLSKSRDGFKVYAPPPPTTPCLRLHISASSQAATPEFSECLLPMNQGVTVCCQHQGHLFGPGDPRSKLVPRSFIIQVSDASGPGAFPWIWSL